MAKKPKHPGKIAYYEIHEGEEILAHTDSISGVPEDSRFCQTEKGLVPIVKVVAILDKEKNPVEITEYGPNGERLRTTYASSEI